jgi:hypothetical protein
MSYWIPPILFIAFVVFCMFMRGGQSTNDNEDCSIGTHRMYGQYRVLYNDGYLSQPFMGETAKFYAAHFGGRVVSVNYNGPHKRLPSRAR